MAIVHDEEFEFLKRRADSLNLFIAEHKNFDPCLGNGSLYIMPKRKTPQERCPTFLKYATPEQCWEFFEAYK